MPTVAQRKLKRPRPGRDLESQKLIERFFQNVGSVFSLPTAAMQILQVTNDPHSEAADLLKAVQRDPAIAARILRIVNSSFYSLRRSIADLKTAITLLGFSEVRNLALTASISSLFGSGGSYGDYSRKGLWDHCIGVGSVARVIARNGGRVGPGEAYLAGLLHDLGLILIDQYLRRPFCEVLNRLTPETPTCEVEVKTLGFDHAELGSYMGRCWCFPDEIVAAIRYHHVPQQYEGSHRDTVWVVAMANFLCTLQGLSSLGVRNVAEPPDEVVERLDFHPEHIPHLKQQLDETLTQAGALASWGWEPDHR
ncbi:MAG: HDOD domain-containing protein [Pirellulales bacterium]|nr:HDOD domain-containing protein [Pirellulales bacterium]